MIAYSLLPIGLVVLSFIFWGLFMILAKKKRFPMGPAITSILVPFYTVHPHIVNGLYRNFRCVDVDGTYRLEDDYEVECWSGDHSFWTYTVVIPALIVWGIGVPLIHMV